MKPSILIALLAALYVVGGQAHAVVDPDAASVVVVVNSSDPESVAIGEYYAAQRGIPAENIIGLKMPLAETISLEQFVETIHNPLLNALLESEWLSGVKSSERDSYGRERLAVAVHSIRYLVTVRGVPLRFSDSAESVDDSLTNFAKHLQTKRAAVDSELALLTAPPAAKMTGVLRNPYFEGRPVSVADANRVLKVSRLDGPSKRDVIALIDRSIEAEERGLIGRAYIDSGGPHAKGDEWILEAGDLAKAAFFDTDFESSKRPLGYRDRLDAPAIYIGWYRHKAYGPWRESQWSVPAGAIGYHLHSFSATTVRSRQRAWLGPLVAQGYCATVGYTYEPYLEYTIRPQIFLEHLLKGGSFGDAVSVSNPALSWQTVAVGDPLYRPFKLGLEEQLERSMDGPLAGYLGLRQLNRLQAQSGDEAALAYARRLFVTHPSLAVAYRLAKLYENASRPQAAVEVLKLIRFINSFTRDEYALVQRIANKLHKHGESRMAFEIYEKLLADRAVAKDLRLALLDGASPLAAAVGEAALASRWRLESQTIKNPAKGK